ncbi:tetratricopeptide repeat protein [Micromonospora echinofusca]|uniref:Tetratricopeptide repeat protein n=1 Tax=Micromonospora echinofusca TaxID=47858 RepID=A0ABS3VMH7_MICEH|nr:tetratricopeptide repeat protein [Micromonospora echinofusca]MBO4205756.1 tetratricopeptide repeat protein [Micromonospora echinofusca]
MSSGFGDLTVQAHHLVATGDLAAAQELLADALADADPRPAYATAELTEAAGLQARVLLALGDAHGARGWAAFAYSATTRLHGPADPRTVAAAATLAAVLHRVGSHTRAARLYREVVIELTASDGPESLRVLAAHADLATVEYARGECTVARNRLADAWELHREVYGDGHPAGIKMLARLGAMERDCGLFTAAHEHLDLARELCRQHLAADDPLAGQVAALSRAAANPDHVCADGTPSAPPHREQPVVPAARTPSDPGAFHERYDVDPASTRQPYDSAPDPYDVPPSVPAPRHSPEEPGAAGGYPHLDDGVDDGPWWPPEEPGPAYRSDPTAPGYPTDGPDPAYQPPLPPAVPELTRGGSAHNAPGSDLAGIPRNRHLPARRGNRLPVRVAPPAGSRRRVPLVVGGVVVVLLGTAAVVAGVASVDDPVPPAGPSGTPGPPTATRAATANAAPGPAPASPGTPPTSVRLRDNRDSITLTWTYPRGAEGPVVISGGRSGQQPRAFEELPAGSGRYVVHGLDRTTDYCFTVAVVYSVDTVGRARAVCTTRRR